MKQAGRHSPKGMRRLPGRMVLGLAALLAMPTVVYAFSLDEIRVHSTFGEKFRAEIPLRLTLGEVAKGVQAAIADKSVYRILDMPHHSAVANLKVSLKGHGSRRRIHLHSEVPLRTPFFNLLLKTSVGVGAHYRNYPILLEMPQVEEVAVVPSLSIVQQSREIKSPSRKALPSVSKAVQSGPYRYGPVRTGETLASIAKKIRSNHSASQAQMMAAIWTINKKRFLHGNMHALPVGVYLDLPTQTELSKWRKTDILKAFDQPPVLAAKKHEPSSIPLRSVRLPPAKQGEDYDLRLTMAEDRTTKAAPEQMPTPVEPSASPLRAVRLLPAKPESAMDGRHYSLVEVNNIERVKSNERSIEAKIGKQESKQEKATAQIEPLSDKLTEFSQQLAKNERKHTSLKSQLSLLQDRLAVLERKSALRTVKPSPPPEPEPSTETSHKPKPVSVTSDQVLPHLSNRWQQLAWYGSSGLLGFLLAGLLAWLSRKRADRKNEHSRNTTDLQKHVGEGNARVGGTHAADVMKPSGIQMAAEILTETSEQNTQSSKIKTDITEKPSKGSEIVSTTPTQASKLPTELSKTSGHRAELSEQASKDYALAIARAKFGKTTSPSTSQEKTVVEDEPFQRFFQKQGSSFSAVETPAVFSDTVDTDQTGDKPVKNRGAPSLKELFEKTEDVEPGKAFEEEEVLKLDLEVVPFSSTTSSVPSKSHKKTDTEQKQHNSLEKDGPLTLFMDKEL